MRIHDYSSKAFLLLAALCFFCGLTACSRVSVDRAWPDDAVPFGGHYYKVFEVEEMSWHEKKAACEAMGGYLCCIETAEEQAFIAALAAERYLSLGGTDEAEEDVWVWVNGAPVDFTAWYPNQPNNYGDEEDYLATYDDGLWVDVAVEGLDFWMPTGYICEWE